MNKTIKQKKHDHFKVTDKDQRKNKNKNKNNNNNKKNKKTKERFVNIDEDNSYINCKSDQSSYNLITYYENYYKNEKNTIKCNFNFIGDINIVQSDDDNNDIIEKEKKQQERINAIIESRKTWPVGITTRAALRMMRRLSKSTSNENKNTNKNDCYPLRQTYHKEMQKLSSNNNSTSILNANQSYYKCNIYEPDTGLFKLKLIRILVFGSMTNRQDDFLRKCRDNFIIKSDIQKQYSTTTGTRNDLLSIYTINYACGLSQVSLELCLIHWPDSFMIKSEFYHQTFGKYFQMTNLALGYYDPDDLESIEHMQSWMKAFYQYHGKNKQSVINSIVIRLDDQRSLFLNKKDRFDHVISSLLNKYRSSMHHLTIKYRLFHRRPSLKPLWKIIYHLVVDKVENKHDLIIDSVAKAKARIRNTKQHKKPFGKSLSQFIRSLTNRFVRSIWNRLF